MHGCTFEVTLRLRFLASKRAGNIPRITTEHQLDQLRVLNIAHNSLEGTALVLLLPYVTVYHSTAAASECSMHAHS